MFIQTETTPNPNALKFLPGKTVNENEPRNFFSKEEASDSPFSLKLFELDYVEGVYIGKDFITVTKANEADWDLMKPEILMIIMDFVSSGQELIKSTQKKDHQNIDNSNLSDAEKTIIEIIENKVRPSVAMDGGDIIYKGFENGIVLLELHGACSGCPSSTITLKNGIESMLKHYVPEVQEVEAVNM